MEELIEDDDLPKFFKENRRLLDWLKSLKKSIGEVNYLLTIIAFNGFDVDVGEIDVTLIDEHISHPGGTEYYSQTLDEMIERGAIEIGLSKTLRGLILKLYAGFQAAYKDKDKTVKDFLLSGMIFIWGKILSIILQHLTRTNPFERAP